MTRRDVALLNFLLVLPAILFFWPFLSGRTFFLGDILYSFHPWLTYAAQSLQAGHFPLWNPYSSCGEPFLANPQVMMFFPCAAVFWLFPFSGALGSFLCLNQALLFLAVYLAVRRWFGTSESVVRWKIAFLSAAGLAWGGFAVTLWEFPSASATLPFIAFVLLFTLAGNGPLLLLSTTLMFFAGYVQFSYYALLMGGLILIVKTFRQPRKFPQTLPSFGFWMCAVIGGCLLALPQIFPSWEATNQSLRTALTLEEARHFVISPLFAIKFFVPEIFNKVALPFSMPAFGAEFWPVQRNWLNTFYAGTPFAIFAAVGLVHSRRREVLTWVVIALLAGTIAMGIQPLFSWLRALVPGLRYMTHFSNAMIIVLVAMSFLVCLGYETSLRKPLAFWILWALAFILVASLIVFPSLRQWILEGLLGVKGLDLNQHQHVIQAAWKSAFGLLVSAAIMFSPQRARIFLFLVLTLSELWLFGRDIHPMGEARFFHKPVALAKALSNTSFRLSFHPDLIRQPKILEGNTIEQGYQSARQKLFPNTNIPFRVPSTWGYEVFPMKTFSEFRRSVDLEHPLGAQMHFLGASLIVSRDPLPASVVAQTASASLYKNNKALPRVSWVQNAITIGNRDERLSFLETRWRPSAEVVLEEPVSEATSSESSSVDGPDWSESPGRLRAEVNRGPGWLVYSELSYPGWSAYLNGVETPIRRANHAFMCVRTGAAPSSLRLVYRPGLFRVGLLFSLVGFIAFAIWAARLFLRRTA